jgi:hypothetical protein
MTFGPANTENLPEINPSITVKGLFFSIASMLATSMPLLGTPMKRSKSSGAPKSKVLSQVVDASEIHTFPFNAKVNPAMIVGTHLAMIHDYNIREASFGNIASRILR